MNGKQAGTTTQPHRGRALHVHDHRSRPLKQAAHGGDDEDVTRCATCGSTLPHAVPAIAAADQTLVQPRPSPSPPLLQPLAPTTAQHVYVPETLPLREVPPAIDFPLDDGEPSDIVLRWGVVIGTLLAFAALGLLIALGVRAFSDRAAPKASTEETLPPVVSATPVVPTSVPPPVSTAPPATVAITTVVVPATPAPTTVALPPTPSTRPPSTIAPSTDAPAAIPSTTVDAAEPPVPTAVSAAGPGTSQVLHDPLPSGISFAEVEESFALTQQLADALAAGDWDLVRRLEPARAGTPDSAFGGYTGLDQASLILVDARPQDNGYRHLLVSVANEGNGAQTSLYCLEWSANPETGYVVQHGGAVGKLTTLDGTVSSETAVNDRSLVDLMSRRCVWS